MNNEYLKLIEEMTDLLENLSLSFMVKAFKSTEQDTSDLINLVLSSHISSMLNLMNKLSHEHPEMNVLVKKFIANLVYHISKQNPIEKIKVINKKSCN